MESKRCPNCGETKPLDLFNKNKRKKSGYGSWCKRCIADARLKVYYSNPQKHRENEKDRVLALKDKIVNYLSSHPCVDCGETDPIVLQFDHVRGSKEFNVSRMAHKGFSWGKIEEEIAKCEVRCANCHLRATAKRAGNWHRGRVAQR